MHRFVWFKTQNFGLTHLIDYIEFKASITHTYKSDQIRVGIARAGISADVRISRYRITDRKSARYATEMLNVDDARNDCAYKAAKESCVTFKNDIPVIKTPEYPTQGEL